MTASEITIGVALFFLLLTCLVSWKFQKRMYLKAKAESERALEILRDVELKMETRIENRDDGLTDVHIRLHGEQKK